MLLNCQESCNNKPGVNKAFCATIAVYLLSSQNYILIWVGIGIYKRASHQFWIFNFSSMILSTKPGRKKKKYWYKHYHSLFTIHNSSILEHLCNITRQFYWHSEVRKIIQNIENKHRSVKLGNSEFEDQESKAKTIFIVVVSQRWLNCLKPSNNLSNSIIRRRYFSQNQPVNKKNIPVIISANTILVST